MPITKLDRMILSLTGDGAKDWLEGLITNRLTDDLNFAAMLTPQGKIIADFFVWTQDGLFIDTPVKFGAALHKRLKMYRLRAPIEIEDVSAAFAVYVSWDDALTGRQDPRAPHIRRHLTPDSLGETAALEEWDAYRLSQNLPDSEWDFGAQETFPANANMDRLNGVDFKKGCFVGQEVVSRMHRKTEIRKRLHSVRLSEETDETELKIGDRTAGNILHRRGHLAMAMIRFDRLPEDGAGLKAGGVEAVLI